MKQTRIRLFGSVLMIIIIPMALFILGIWKNSDSYLTTQVLISGIAVLVIISFSMAFWVYSGIIRPLEKLQQDIAARDKADSEREISPLVQAEDATLLDTTGLSIDEVVSRILSMCQ